MQIPPSAAGLCHKPVVSKPASSRTVLATQPTISTSGLDRQNATTEQRIGSAQQLFSLSVRKNVSKPGRSRRRPTAAR
ncbi:hypothetical protein BKA81DRAFT_22941 [Phyllosticta paracitricarpa]